MEHRPDAERRLTPRRPYDLEGSVSGLRMGRWDPSFCIEDGRVSLARMTPAGPATLTLADDSEQLTARGFGPGADWLVEHAASIAGLEDRPAGFKPTDRPMRRLLREHRGLHLPRLPVVFDRVAQVVILQKVTTLEAQGSWRRLVLGLGTPAPGPHELVLPPDPTLLARPPSHTLQRFGVLPLQARTLRRIGRESRRLEAAAARGPEALARMLGSIPGIGDWTVQAVLGSALGEPDAVPLGDYNLPHTVAWNLAGEPRGTDARMLELLEPYRNHRYRAIRLLWASGSRAPRRGPRMPLRPVRGGPRPTL